MLRFKKDDGTSYPEWEEKKLGDIADITKLAGFEFTKHVVYSDRGEVIALRGLNVKHGKLILDDIKFIDNSEFSKLNRSKLYKGDILFTYVGTIGEMAVIDSNEKYYLAPNVSRIRLYKDSPKFLMYQMYNNIFFQKVIYPLVATSPQPALSMENIRKFKVFVPCLEEQQKIADFLSEVDNIIAVSEQEIESLEMQKKGAMQKIFSQEVRFKADDGSEFPEWEEKMFSSYFEVITKQTGFDYTKTIKPALVDRKIENSIPYLQTKNFEGISFDYSTDYYIPMEVAFQYPKIILDKKCILLSIVGASIGNVALFPGLIKCFLSGAICVAKPKDEKACDFVYYYMISKYGQKQIRDKTKGGGQATITIEDIRNIIINSPCIEEQQKITDFLSEFDNAIEYAKEELEIWKNVKKGLLQQMFE